MVTLKLLGNWLHNIGMVDNPNWDAELHCVVQVLVTLNQPKTSKINRCSNMPKTLLNTILIDASKYTTAKDSLQDQAPNMLHKIHFS